MTYEEKLAYSKEYKRKMRESETPEEREERLLISGMYSNLRALAMTDAERAKKNLSKKNWVARNRDRVRAYDRRVVVPNRKERRRVDPEFRLRINIRARLRSAVLRMLGKADRSPAIEKLIGCPVSYLKEYIESKFQPGMTWKNYGAWQVDHIYPLSRFNLSEISERVKANHYTNLQPLWAEDNLKKSDSIAC